MRSKYCEEPDVKLHRSKPVNHLRFKSVRVAASSEASLQKLKTWFTSIAAAFNHPYDSERTLNLRVRVNEDVMSVLSTLTGARAPLRCATRWWLETSLFLICGSPGTASGEVFQGSVRPEAG